MNRLLIGSIASLALSASSALAADMGMPLKAPYYAPPPAVSWTGCYVDGSYGYGFWNQAHYGVDSISGAVLTPTTNTGGEGWMGRFGGGCDYQVSSSFVVGAFADYDLTSFKGTFQEPVSGLIGTEKETGAWAAGGRIGYLVTPNLLTYFDAGYTEARFSSIGLFTDTVPSFATIFSVSANTYHGWFIGGGTEYALTMPWIPVQGLFWRSEWRYADYQGANVAITPLAITTTNEHMQKDVQTLSSGLVWRFNFGGPLATRY